MLAATPHRKDPLMSSPTPPDKPDQGLSDVPPDQGLNDTNPDQGLNEVNRPARSRTPIFVGIGAIVVVIAGIIAAVFH
jgi:hypothetical protein